MRSPTIWLTAGLFSLALIACGSEGGDPTGASATSGATASGAGGGTTASGTGGASTSTSTTAGTSTGAGAGGAGGSSGNNGFPAHWADGLACATEPKVAVWAYDDDTYILRQSLCTNFEGPFLYLLFGDDKVLLQDTGTGAADVASAVSGVITAWLAKKGKASIDLVVTHSHSHGDHVGGDSQFAGLPKTTVVGTLLGDVQTFFGITTWPTQAVTYDLGGRTLDVLPIPGHQKAHLALYDRSRRLLLTGDSLYPGRLYINDWPTYQTSIQRLVDFTAANPVDWVLGTHIEMTTTPKKDYPMQSNKHASEHALEQPLGRLVELNEALITLGATPTYEKHDDFIIYPL